MNNNFVLPIPKDLKNIQSKLFFGLTKRQLIGFGTGIALGGLIYFGLKGFGSDVAMYGMFFAIAPVFFATIYQKDGMYTEQWIKVWLEYNYLNPQKRHYKTTIKNMEIAEERKVVKSASVRKAKPVPGNKTVNRQKKRKKNSNARHA